MPIELVKFLTYFQDALILGGVFALVAVGYSLVYGIIKLINFAHGEVAMFGAFFAFITLGYLASGEGGVSDWVFVFALLVSVTMTILLGWGLEFVAYRPLRKASRLSALITTIGMSLLLQNLAAVIWDPPEDKVMAKPEIFKETNVAFTVGHDSADTMSLAITWKVVIVMTLVVLLMALLWWIVEKTTMGKAMRACSQDADAAALMGININRVVAFTFIVGAAMASVSGFLMGTHIGLIRYDMGIQIGIVAFAAAVLGGIGSIPGAILGGFLIGLSQEMSAGYLSELGKAIGHPSINGAYKQTVAFLIMIIVLIVKPSGLLGKEEADRA